MASLTPDQLDDLQSFLKDWLRHAGRTQADLRRALRLPSVRMPVLLEALNRTYSQGGLAELVNQLCAIEADWHREDQADLLQGLEPGTTAATAAGSSLEQLDLLLQEIRLEQSAELATPESSP